MLHSIIHDPEVELPLPTSRTRPLCTFWSPKWEIRTFSCLAITSCVRNINSLKISIFYISGNLGYSRVNLKVTCAVASFLPAFLVQFVLIGDSLVLFSLRSFPLLSLFASQERAECFFPLKAFRVYYQCTLSMLSSSDMVIDYLFGDLDPALWSLPRCVSTWPATYTHACFIFF